MDITFDFITGCVLGVEHLQDEDDTNYIVISLFILAICISWGGDEPGRLIPV